MRYILLFFIPFFYQPLFGQTYQIDNLYEKRERYSTKSKFNKFCKYKYLLCKDSPPPPPPPTIPKLIKYFKIPKNIRLNMFPFNKCETILLEFSDENKILKLNNNENDILSNIVFNYSYEIYFGELYSYTNFVDKIKVSLFFKLKDSQEIKYYKYLSSGEVETNFTNYELTQFDIDKNKIELLIKIISK